MKRIFLLLLILFISVLSTACVNNFAIQELNNKAQEYMEKGDTDSAICRYEASLDLDSNVFETRYNLGVAYLNAKKYDKAKEMLTKAAELKPDFPDTYYSLAVAIDEMNSSEIDKIKNPQSYKDEEEEKETPVLSDENYELGELEEAKVSLTEEEKEIITQKINEIVDAYKKYLEVNPDTKEKYIVEKRISSLQSELEFKE